MYRNTLGFVVMAVASVACSPARQGPAKVLASRPAGDVDLAARGPQPSERVVVYASEGAQLHTLALDGRTGELSIMGSVSLPEPVHYAAADAGGRVLYVSVSDGASRHGLHAFGIDPRTGALAPHGQQLEPPLGRIIHLSIDPSGRHLVLAHNRAAELSSVRLDGEGHLEDFVEQAAPARTGFFAHQASLDPSGTRLVACGLGADAAGTSPEQPGSLTLFRFDRGQLERKQAVLPGPGLGPRHLDYAGDRVYVVMERGNRLSTYHLGQDALDEHPAFETSTLQRPEAAQPGQRAGAVHVHPSGKYLYVSNRSNRTTRVTAAGQIAEVFAGGVNDIALFALDPGSGEPRRVAHYDTLGFEPRTFTIEPSGRYLVVANQLERTVVDGEGLARDASQGGSAHTHGEMSDASLRTVRRSLVVFEIGDDGRLVHRQTHPFASGDLFWIGSLQLPE